MPVAGLAAFFGPDAAARVDQIAHRLHRGAPANPASLVANGYAIAAVGGQPIAAGGAAVAVDGTIDNHAVIRKEMGSEGYAFSTTSPAEAALPLYQEFGPDGLRLLEGEHVLVLADPGGRPGLWRDRYGSRSLFYGLTPNGGLAAASEPHALEGLVDQVRDLPPGCYYHPRTGEFAYFAMPLGTAYIHDPVAGAALVRYHLADAIRHRLPASGPVAVLLDDGSASIAIAALVADAGRELVLFSLSPEGGEARVRGEASAVGQALAQHLHASLVEVDIQPTPAIEDRLRPLLAPASDAALPHTTRTYLLARAAAERGFSSVLSSVGADALFGSSEIEPGPTDADTHAALQRAASDRPRGVFRWADAAAAAAGVELRAVYADPNVAMAAWEVSPQLKYRDGRTSWLLGFVAARYLPSNLAAVSFEGTLAAGR